MTFKGIVWKNFKYGIRKYIAFFLCSTLTIAIFFIFSNLMYSKEINDFMEKAGMGAQYVFSIMVIILSVFSIGFISYINSSKNKSRSKEFGLYMTMGMSNKDISKLIVIEDSFIVSASIAGGMLVGMVFSRFVYIINVKMIGVENGKFVLDYRSFILTGIIFVVIYIFNLIITLFSRKKMNIRELITIDRKSEYSESGYKSLAVLGIALMLILAAVAAAAASSRDIAMKKGLVLTAIVMGMAGIYLVISNIVGIAAAFAHCHKNLYARSLLNLSELKYTSRKNTNVLFILSLLSGMILLCSASTFALLSLCDKIVDDQPKEIITYVEAMGENSFEQGLADKLVDESGAGLKEHMVFDCTFAYRANNQLSKGIPICIISSATLSEFMGDKVNLKENEAEILASDPLLMPPESKMKDIEISNGKATHKINLLGTIINNSFRNEMVIGNRYILVVSDKLYADLSLEGKELNGKIHEIRVDNWRKTGKVFDELNKLRANNNPISKQFLITGNYYGYKLMKQLYSTFVFGTNFISILFFAASILILLFRQYENQDKMAKKYSQLRKIGMTRKEFKKYVGAQTRFIFMVPLIFGLFLGACLMLIIQSIMGGNDLYREFWNVSFKVAVIYIALQIAFCIAVSDGYFNRIISIAEIK